MDIYNNRLPMIKRPVVERYLFHLLTMEDLALRRHVSAWVMPWVDDNAKIAHLVASYLPQKTLLFGHHKETLLSVQTMMEECKIPEILLYGDVPMKKRDPIIQRFKQDNDTTVAILGMQALAEGINLQEATSVVFLELAWTPETQLQAEARCHRLTSQDPVRAYYPCLPHSLDHLMWDNLRRRQATADSLLDIDPNYPEEALQHSSFQAHVSYRDG